MFESPPVEQVVVVTPPHLQRGDTIAMVFPASYFDIPPEEAKDLLEKKRAWLETHGFNVRLYPDEPYHYGYLAGTDQERADALMAAWHNEDVKAIWCVRGGYGSTRILDYLDFAFIEAHPKIFIGMSDITTLHQALIQKSHLITYLSPALTFFARDDDSFDDEYALSALQGVLVEGEVGAFPFPPGEEMEIVRPGQATGRVVGGNLTLVASLCGTPWQLDTTGKILVLEDIWEVMYRLDRLLLQLKQSGLLDNVAGVILGDFSMCITPPERSLNFDEVIDLYFKDAPYPVIKNFPTGHGKYQTTIPLHGLVTINTDTKEVSLREPAVSL